MASAVTDPTLAGPAATPGTPRRRPRPLRRTLQWTWLLALFLLAWELAFRGGRSLFVPPVSAIAQRLRDRWFSGDLGTLFTSDLLRESARATLGRLAVGLALCLVLGIAVGLVLGTWHRAEQVVRPLIRFFVSTPATMFLPVGLVVFGLTDQMITFLVVLGGIWPVLLNTIDGVRGIDPATLASARALRLRGPRLLVRVVLPAASPQIFAGVRVALGVVLIVVVIAEMFVATEGLGFQLVYAQRTFAFTDLWAVVFLIGLFGIVLNGCLFFVERACLRWHRQRGRS